MNSEDIFLAVVSTTLLILLLIAGIVLAFFISGRQRVKQQMELINTRLAFERELRQVETEVSEHIMSQFAQELHDNIGQLLTATHIQIENQKLDHPDLSEGFKPIEIYLGEVTQQLRLLSRTLNHDYLGHIGLAAALLMEVERIRALKRFDVHWQATGSVSELEKNQELMVFRIFQEISQNALRHSGAKNLYVLLRSENGFELQVRDDGAGFDKEQVLHSAKASGLRNIIKRATLAGMQLEVETGVGKGSLFILKKVSNLG